MSTMTKFFCVLAITAFAFAGCSDDSTDPTMNQSRGLMQGEIRDADFAITLDATGEGEEGPFVLEGTNLHYEDSLQALVVDLTLRNDGDVAHVLPVALTFVDLIPANVTVQNPDNGINGEGASIDFAFANDDNQWTPGETSLPRTVRFGVAQGTSIGFAARLDVGEPLDGGEIAGLVWNDANENGVIDSGEEGIEGVEVSLNGADNDTLTTDGTATTDDTGHYSFDGLTGGVYTVSVDTTAHSPTTSSSLTVLLAETEDGVVYDFLDANFGLLGGDDGGDDDDFPVGAYVEVNGQFEGEQLVAMGIDVRRCRDGDDDDRGLTDGDHPGDHDDLDCDAGKLRGPVTEVDAANYSFAVMGVWITGNESNFPKDLEVGDRVDARVHHGDGDDVVLDRIKEWHNDRFEQVHGRIDSVEVDGNTVRATVFGLEVVLRHRSNS